MSSFIETKAKPMNSHAKLQIAIEALDAIADTSRVPDGGRADVARTALKQIGEIDNGPTVAELEAKLTATEQCADQWRQVALDAMNKPSAIAETEHLKAKLEESRQRVSKMASLMATAVGYQTKDVAEQCAQLCAHHGDVCVICATICANAIRAKFAHVSQREQPSAESADREAAGVQHGDLSCSADGTIEAGE